MSGHSRWHNIKARKTKMDAQRGKLFSKITREIIVATREGGPNPDTNLRLRKALEKAREINLPSENIKRAIQRGTGEVEGAHYEEKIIEGYAPGGVAIMLSVLTDNVQRTISSIRSIFTRSGGNLGEVGCVSWLFERNGIIIINKEDIDEDKIFNLALECSAKDIRVSDACYEIITLPEEFEKTKKYLQDNEIKIASAEVTMIPKTQVKVDGPDAEKVLKLISTLEDYEDVQHLYANFDIEDKLMEKIAGGDLK